MKVWSSNLSFLVIGGSLLGRAFNIYGKSGRFTRAWTEFEFKIFMLEILLMAHYFLFWYFYEGYEGSEYWVKASFGLFWCHPEAEASKRVTEESPLINKSTSFLLGWGNEG